MEIQQVCNDFLCFLNEDLPIRLIKKPEHFAHLEGRGERKVEDRKKRGRRNEEREEERGKNPESEPGIFANPEGRGRVGIRKGEKRKGGTPSLRPVLSFFHANFVCTNKKCLIPTTTPIRYM